MSTPEGLKDGLLVHVDDAERVIATAAQQVAAISRDEKGYVNTHTRYSAFNMSLALRTLLAAGAGISTFAQLDR